MKTIINRILSVFKNSNKKDFQFNDIGSICQSASEELSEFCKIENLDK